MVCLGIPNSSTSMGAVILASTSSGVMPGALTMILTWVGDTSGKASMGMVVTACQPPPVSNSTISNTSKRWVSANLINIAIMDNIPLQLELKL